MVNMYISGVVVSILMSIVILLTTKSKISLIKSLFLFGTVSLLSWLGVLLLFQVSDKLPIE